jgi:predicted enzyme related to lactoylglutathione lyase
MADTQTITNIARLAMVTLDCSDPQEMAHFWSTALGWPIAHADAQYAMITGPDHAIGFGAIDDYQRPQWPDHGAKQYHFDLAVDDIEAAAAQLVELGAIRPAEQPGETWVVLLDPAGHPFCLTNAANWG